MSALPATRDARIALAERVVRGALGPEDTLRPAQVIDDGWKVAIDVATFERGIALRNAIAEAVFGASFPALTTHSPAPLPGTTRCRVWIVVHLGAEAAS